MIKKSVGNTNTQIFIEFHRNLMNYRLEINLYSVGCCFWLLFLFCCQFDGAASLNDIAHVINFEGVVLPSATKPNVYWKKNTAG